jgi:hypothetical protein
MSSANTTLQNNIDALSTAASTARTALQTLLQAAIDANKLTSDNAESLLSGRLDTLESDPTTATALAAVSAAVTSETTARTNADTALDGRLDTLEADPTTKTYVDNAVAGLVDGAGSALDTLNELSAALGDDANFATTVTNQIAAVQADVNQNEADADAAIAAVQADVDQNETDADAAIAAVQADVDQNETDADAAIAAANVAMLAAVATVQADVDQNETDADAAIAAVQADVDQNESDADAAIAAVQADVDQNEADADTAIALKANIASPTFTGTVGGITKSMVGLGNVDNTADTAKPVSTAQQAAIDAVQADVDQNESDADTALALKAPLADPTFTGTAKAEKIDVDNDGGYFLRFDRNTSTQLDIITGNIPSGGNLNIKNSNANNAKVVVYSDLFWCRNLGGNSGNGSARFDGDVTMKLASSVTPSDNSDMMIEATNNTTLTFKLKGSDGTVRSGTITLS